MVSAVVVPDGASEKVGLGDELGSEEDLLYEEFRGSGHRFGHPGGGGGEQLAINEVGMSSYFFYHEMTAFTDIMVRSTVTGQDEACPGGIIISHYSDEITVCVF